MNLVSIDDLSAKNANIIKIIALFKAKIEEKVVKIKDIRIFKKTL